MWSHIHINGACKISYHVMGLCNFNYIYAIELKSLLMFRVHDTILNGSLALPTLVTLMNITEGIWSLLT